MSAADAPSSRGATRASRRREVSRALEALRAVAERRRKPSYLLTRREYVTTVAADPELSGLPSGPEVAGAFGGWERAREQAAAAAEENARPRPASTG